jgi:peroxiredoxin Q/BCP
MPQLNVGDRIPAFTLSDQNGDLFQIEEALAKGPVVLFFYPKDGTPVCTAEACSFRDASGDFMAAGATVVGISSDDVASHRQFASKHALSFPLLADEGGDLRKKLGVPRAMLGLGEGRVTYVIDQEGIIRHRFDALLSAHKHVEESLQTLRSLKGIGR